MQVFGEEWYHVFWLQGLLSIAEDGTACDCGGNIDETFDIGPGFITAVPATLNGSVHESGMRADVIGADRPIRRIRRNVFTCTVYTKEDKDGIADGEFELFAFDPDGPFVESTLGVSGVVNEL